MLAVGGRFPLLTFTENNAASFGIEDELLRKKRREMLRDTDRANAGPAAAVRNAKRFVQIEMTNVRAHVARPAKPDLRIHVRAIHVNLAAVRMNNLANFADGGFENAVRGWIRHHQCGQIIFVRLGFGAQISEIDVAIFQARDRHHLETRP